MEKYGLVIPEHPENPTSDYVALERFNNLKEAERAFDACTIERKTLVRYDQIGPFMFIGTPIRE